MWAWAQIFTHCSKDMFSTKDITLRCGYVYRYSHVAPEICKSPFSPAVQGTDKVSCCLFQSKTPSTTRAVPFYTLRKMWASTFDQKSNQRSVSCPRNRSLPGQGIPIRWFPRYAHLLLSCSMDTKIKVSGFFCFFFLPFLLLPLFLFILPFFFFPFLSSFSLLFLLPSSSASFLFSSALSSSPLLHLLPLLFLPSFFLLPFFFFLFYLLFLLPSFFFLPFSFHFRLLFIFFLYFFFLPFFFFLIIFIFSCSSSSFFFFLPFLLLPVFCLGFIENLFPVLCEIRLILM